MTFILTTIIFMMISGNLFANGVDVMEVPGNTVIPIQNENVRMIKEIVTFNEDDEVKAIFTFKNTTTEDISFTMGFPFTKDTDPLSVPYGAPNSGKFAIRINGKEVQADKKAVSANTKLNIGSEYAFMYTWPISFKPHEEKTVECIYTASWNCSVGPFPYCQYFTYITKTGALWKDKIGRADFYLTLPREYAKDNADGKLDLDINPSNYKIVNNTVEWHFLNWEPNEDISIHASRSSSYPLEYFELTAMLHNILDIKTAYEGNIRLYTLKDLQDSQAQLYDSLDRLYVKVIRNEIFARHGKVFNDSNLQSIFIGRGWYKPNPNYSDSMLNEYEKKNIKFILNYEKEKGWVN